MTEDQIRREVWNASWMTQGRPPTERDYRQWLDYWPSLLERGEQIRYRSPRPNGGTGGLAYARDRLYGWQAGGADVPTYGPWAIPESDFFDPVPAYPGLGPSPEPEPSPQPTPAPQPPTDLKPALDRLEKKVDEVRVLLELLLTDPNPSYYGTVTWPRILGGGTTTVRLEPVQSKRS